MPDLNKQTLVNLLIDSPLREPIKINLIDIVNNTADADLPKIYPTIIKELEIFQKATDRRMKLAEETITKLSGGATPPTTTLTPAGAPAPAESLPTSPLPPAPPLPAPPKPVAATEGLSVPPLDLPPLPRPPSQPPAPPAAQPAATAPAPINPAAGDEAALAEIQKELDALKSSASVDVSPTTPPQA